MRREKKGVSLKKVLISSAAMASMATALSMTATAQDEGDEEEAAVQDTIVITGSRIPTDPNLASSTPVQSIDEEQIRLSGELNLADVVNDIPALVSSFTGANTLTDGFADVDPGANILNLRGLGGDRTLTLVNGRRHVAGFRGSQAVDIGTIPRALVQNVEVTTGGASAIYGADAVTGVVNFILKDDFEGMQLDARAGVSGEMDAENFAVDLLWGQNFHNDRGNVVIAFTAEQDSGITMGDRDWSRDNGIDTTQTNPDSLPDPNAPARAVIQDPRFWLTSQEGSIAPGFGNRSTVFVDINGNGIADCQESEGGRVGFLAGCWLTNPDGSVRVNQDGIVLNGLWGIGGDGGRLNFNRDSLYPSTDRFVFNVNSNYDISDNMNVFFEGKYVHAKSTTFGEQDSFYDTLEIRADNAFIPSELQSVADTVGYLLLTQDPLDWSDNNDFTYTRETWRFVGGLEWEFAPGHFAEFSANYGNFTNTSRETGLYLDRVFAAIDAVEAPDGSIVCRSDLDATASYPIDYFTAGNGFADGGFSSDRYYSFTPGDGQCQPLNPFGTYSASAAAQNFVTSQLEDKLEVEQTVLSAIAFGEFDVLDVLLDGPIGYAGGIEYRDESSKNTLDPLTLGILPAGTSFTPGVQVSTVDPFLFSFTDIDNSQQFSTEGGYDVTDIFAEIRLPVFRDRPFAKEFSLDAAIRLADYSTLGDATTWKVGGTWAPVQDLSFRGTFSEAVRAPNISELFDPQLPINVNATDDPCDPTNVTNGAATRQATCVAWLEASGVPTSDILDATGAYIWTNPLTARFSGVSGGNPDLDVETAETLTLGAIYQPSFVDGLSITLDYWDIEIEDGIAAISDVDVLNGCADSANPFPGSPLCADTGRRADGGLNFLESGQINFAKLEASGIDLAVNYTFDVGQNTFTTSLVGSKQEKLDRFFDPADPNSVDPELKEIQRPEFSGNVSLGWERGPWQVGLQTTYQSKQAVAEIEDVLGLNGNTDLYGADGFFDETYIFDVNTSYEHSDTLTFYGGVNNLTDESPFSTELAWPVDPRGRFFFMGVTYKQ
mgnify:FL=1